MLTFQGFSLTPYRKAKYTQLSVKLPFSPIHSCHHHVLQLTTLAAVKTKNFLDSSPPSSILGKCFGCSHPFTYFPAPKAQAQIHTKPCFWQCQGVTQESSGFLFFKLSHQFFISSSLPHLTRESQESLVFEY